MENLSRSNTSLCVLVRGIGDVGSAVIWQLKNAGYDVIAHEDRQPRTIRRKMAYADAFWHGQADLNGIRMVRVSDRTHVRDHEVGLVCRPFDSLVKALHPDIIVDARIVKSGPVDSLKGLAKLTIGIGPNFLAGKDVDLVVESCWGPMLGDIIAQGQAQQTVPNPPAINGIGWQRFVRAPKGGVFKTDCEIAQRVCQGDVIATLDDKPIFAPMDGSLRGLLQDGVEVERREKLIEVDPRLANPNCIGLAERPEAISKGVLKAIGLTQAGLSLTHQEGGRIENACFN